MKLFLLVPTKTSIGFHIPLPIVQNMQSNTPAQRRGCGEVRVPIFAHACGLQASTMSLDGADLSSVSLRPVHYVLGLVWTNGSVHTLLFHLVYTMESSVRRLGAKGGNHSLCGRWVGGPQIHEPIFY